MDNDLQALCFHCFQQKQTPEEICPHCGHDPGGEKHFPLALPQGTILAGRYLVGHVLGQGGFGITYLALDLKTHTPVAVKEFFPESMATRHTGTTQVLPFSGTQAEDFAYGKNQFLEEAQTLAQFTQVPGVVSIHTYFEENGTAYFAMEYVNGVSFKQFISAQGGKLPWQTVRSVLLPVMDALTQVHRAGIIHRDVTPDNIYITRDGKVKLLDFGAARYSLGDHSRSLDVVLKVGYAPKEQYLRRGRQGPFTDVYSVGACFYAALTGFLPPESLERMQEDDLVPPCNRGVILPRAAEDAILRALEVRAEDRFQTMDVFRDALWAADSSPLDVLSPGNLSPAPQPGPGISTGQSFHTIHSGHQPEPVSVPTPDPAPIPNPNPISYSMPGSAPIPAPAPKPKAGKMKLAIGAAVVALVVAAGVIAASFMGKEEVPNGPIGGGGGGGGSQTPVISLPQPEPEPEPEPELPHSEPGTYPYVEWDAPDHGSITYENGDLYTGDLKDDQPHGQGTYTWMDGGVFEGRFREGHPTGRGTYTFLDGSTRTGEWTWAVDDEFHYTHESLNNRLAGTYTGMELEGDAVGQGKFIWEEDDPFCPGWLYAGEMKNNSPDGYGLAVFLYGEYKGAYVGSFSNGYPEGSGTYIYDDDRTLESDSWTWMDQLPCFLKEEYPESHAAYTGMFCEGGANGFGSYIWWDRTVYTGEFEQMSASGAGTYFYTDGSTINSDDWNEVQDSRDYTGMQTGTRACGLGLLIRDGRYYHVGEYKDNIQDGFGIVQWDDGDRYEGVLTDGDMHGQGVYTFADGDQLQGQFQNGEFIG